MIEGRRIFISGLMTPRDELSLSVENAGLALIAALALAAYRRLGIAGPFEKIRHTLKLMNSGFLASSLFSRSYLSIRFGLCELVWALL